MATSLPVAAPPRKRRDAQNGGTVVEFAIVLPLFVAMLFGTIDYAWYLFQKFTLASAVQGGVRAAVSVKENDPKGPYDTAVDAAKANLASGGAVPPAKVSWGPGTGLQLTGTKPLRALTVEGTFIFTPLVGLVPIPNKTLKYSCTMLLDAANADI